MKERRIKFIANTQSLKGVQLTDRAFDFPSPAIATELSFILHDRSNADSAVWTDEFDITIGKSVSKRVLVGCSVVNDLPRNIGSDRRVGPRFDQVHFGMIGHSNVNRQRQSIAGGEDHDLGSFAHESCRCDCPFFAEVNVPSANDSVQ